MRKLDSRVYFITDSSNYSEEEFLRRVEQALKGGVTLLQLREKDKTTREYIALAEKVHALTKQYSITIPQLSIAPPIISVIQCTPERILPITIKRIKTMIDNEISFFRVSFLIRLLNCIIVVGIIHITSIVVVDG